MSNYWMTLEGCVMYGNTLDGTNMTYNMGSILGCIFVSNGGYGLNMGTGAAYSPVQADAFVNYNAFYNNTSGARNNISAGANDVTLTGDPFVSASGNNFALNATAGAGAACRNAGFPGVSPFGTGYQDIGALRHQDPAAGGGETSSVF